MCLKIIRSTFKIYVFPTLHFEGIKMYVIGIFQRRRQGIRVLLKCTDVPPLKALVKDLLTVVEAKPEYFLF